MLTFKSSEDNQSTCFKFIGADTQPKTTHLISNNINLISTNTCLISASCGAGEGLDTCSFYSGPSDATIVAFGESCGSIAYAGGESCGSIAYSGGGESCGSVASSFSGGGSSFSGGGCSYSC